ncbi:MAG: uroporphyrinogen-III C-methyltransferase [Sulfurimonadaceae bacterium]|jgi:uroporphyrin-III C-methyltransferase|nr:uroporphyrinogen-III C-methyltransferase [Sulfurimonadaceae bacterium]
MTKIIQPFSVKKGKIYLVGCGLGDVEQLTLKAYRTIREAKIILYDHLISKEILDLLSSNTRKVYVGKAKDRHSISQERINHLIAGYAEQGFSVARLKSGDPYIFGRGSEEALFLLERGFEVDVIAGISSCVSGSACAGIPPTARGYAASFSVVSAHLKEGEFNTDWLPLLKLSNHTTVVLMGLSLAEQIKKAAYAIGVSPTLPIAIVANASRPEQQSVVTTLSKLDEAAKKIDGPAVIVFGDVVNLHGKLPGYQSQSLVVV